MITIYYSKYIPVSDSIREIIAQEHALGRALLLHGLSELYGLSLTAKQLESGLTAGTRGKPYLADHPDIHFNITHCDGLAACAFSDRPVGVDAELPGYFAEILIPKALSEDEKELLEAAGSHGESLRSEWFFRFWTLKEAYVKMTGTGVDVPLRKISFSFLPAAQCSASPDVVQNSGACAVRCSKPRTYCFQQKLESGHLLSLCCEDRDGKNPAVQLIPVSEVRPEIPGISSADPDK